MEHLVDVRTLADPTRCPSCAAPLTEPRTACPSCLLVLTGPTAGRVWSVSVQAAEMLATRARLLDQLRLERTEAFAPTTAQAAPTRAPAAQLPAPPPPAPRAEWTPRRVQNLLLALGVGLLGVAAVIFVAVSWGRLGVGGRAAVMTGVTALAAAAAYRTGRRGLTATAEALSVLTVGLALLDLAGARASNLFGLGESVDAFVFAGWSAAAVGLLSAVGALALPTRALRVSGAVLGQLALPLILIGRTDDLDQPAAVLAAGMAAQTVAAAAAVVAWPGSRRSRDARIAVAVGAVCALSVSAMFAVVAAYAEAGSLVAGTALLLVLAMVTAVAAEAVVRVRWATIAGAGVLRAAATVILVAAAWAPVVDATPTRWLAAGLAGSAIVLVAATALVPGDRRTSPLGVVLVAAVVPAVDALPAVAASMYGRLQWLDQAWTGQSGAARRLLAVDGPVNTGSWPVVLVLVLGAAALALGSRLATPARGLLAASIPTVAATIWCLAAAADLTYALGLGIDLLVATVLVVGGVLLVRYRQTWLGGSALVSGSVVLTLAVVWSLATSAATLAALPVAATVLAVAVLAGRGVAALRGARLGAATAAVLLLVAEAAALARDGGAAWPAVVALTLALVAGSGGAGLALVVGRAPTPDALWSSARAALVVTATAAVVADVGAIAWWQGSDLAGVGLAITVAAAVVLAGSTVPVPVSVLRVVGLRVVAAPAGLAGLLAASLDADRLWVALLAVGVGTAVLGVRDDHRWGWVSGVLLAASSWVRLALSDVTAPEAYTVPPALALLAVGLWRRHRDPDVRSWPAYAPGLALALVPSLLRAVTDAGELRPLLLGMAALAVLAAGVARRLQAPLVIGSVVLAVNAVVQLAPYLAAAYDVVPRWVSIGLVGLLLLGAGMTYERHVRELRRVGRVVATFG